MLNPGVISEPPRSMAGAGGGVAREAEVTKAEPSPSAAPEEGGTCLGGVSPKYELPGTCAYLWVLPLLEPPACHELVIGAALDSDLGGACIDFAIELEDTDRPPDFDALRLGSGVGMRTEIGAGELQVIEEKKTESMETMGTIIP